MAALAGVAAGGVGECGYPAKDLQQRTYDYASAGVAASCVVAEGAKLVYLTERTRKVV
jgi:hypothetical protein